MASDRPAADGGGQAPAAAAGRLGIFRGAGQLARALAAYRPRAVAPALLLMFGASATEAFGFLMFIPLMQAAGVGAAGGQQSALAEMMAGAANAFGADLALPATLAVFVALAVVRSAIVWQRDVLLAGIRLGFADRFRKTLYEAAARAKWQFLAGQRQSDIQHVLTGDVHRIGQASFHLLRAVVAGALAALQLAAAFLISPLVSTAALLTCAALLALTRPLMRRSRALGDQLTGVNRVIFAQVLDFLAGLKPAKSYALERLHVDRFGEAVSTMRQRQVASTRASATAHAALNAGAAAALAAVAWFAIAGAGLTLPELAVVALLFARVISALVNLQQSAQDLANALPAYRYAQETLHALRRAAEDVAGEEPPAAGRVEPDPRPTEPRMALKAALTVRGVSFDYGQTAQADEAPAAGREALSGIRLDVPAGEITAVSGPSGAGKSTLADILLGLLEPASGTVLVDGAPLDDSNRRRWRRSCAYVPQDPHLFHDTVRANVVWARPGASGLDVRRALRLAAAEDFVAALPQGLDTVVGDRGGRLSGGERQRIALARALLVEPELLVLDEATSQLDARTERRIVDSLRSLRGRMTVVAVTHREALLAAADRIVLLDAGRLAPAGSRPAPAETAAAASGGRSALS